MDVCITIVPEEKKITASAGQSLLAVLRSARLAPDAPCGGAGTCGKCTVLVEGNPVKSCQFVLTEDIQVQLLPKADTTEVLADGSGADVVMNPWGDGPMLAYDIGTTTIVCYLLAPYTGEVTATCSAVNCQQSFGADVVSRIQCALAGELQQLTDQIRRQMADMMLDVCQKAGINPAEIAVVSVVGNPCMQQLFLGISPENLARIPFVPVLKTAQVWDAEPYLPGCGHAKLLIVPDISGYVGADTVGCVLATGIDRIDPVTLMVDIGTNGEMVLGNRHRMTACAAAAGPALEGTRIQFGMRGAKGAIDHVWLEDGTLRCSVIGEGTAVGICGSGLIDAVAVLIETGLLDRGGRLKSREQAKALQHKLREVDGQRVFDLCDGVYLTQKDIREVQLAKGAIAAGVELMAAQLGIQMEEIRQVLLAGAFGSYIKPESACRIGLIPSVLAGKIRAVGNAAGSGARRLACNKEELQRAQKIAETVEFIELAALPEFSECFVENMMYQV